MWLPLSGSHLEFLLSKSTKAMTRVVLQTQYLHINLQSHIGQILFTHLINMLGQAALWYHPKHSLTMLLQVTYINIHTVREHYLFPVDLSTVSILIKGIIYQLTYCCPLCKSRAINKHMQELTLAVFSSDR
jgi:hypothetical protein